MGSRIPLLPGRSRPLIFAHRGASSVAPENTMAAFKAAVELGAPGVELDIHRCSSGELVIFHDDATGRTAPGSSHRIAETPWSVLKTLDIGSWKGSSWRNERPILLSELFEAFGDSIYYDIEIKARTTEDRGLEPALAACLADARLDAATVAVSSFNPIAVRRFKACSRAVPTAVIYCDSKELPWYLRRGFGAAIANTDFLKPEHVQVGGFSVALARALNGRPVVPWTVDDAMLAGRLLEKGCEGIISNAPDKLGLLAQR